MTDSLSVPTPQNSSISPGQPSSGLPQNSTEQSSSNQQFASFPNLAGAGVGISNASAAQNNLQSRLSLAQRTLQELQQSGQNGLPGLANNNMMGGMQGASQEQLYNQVRSLSSTHLQWVTPLTNSCKLYRPRKNCARTVNQST